MEYTANYELLTSTYHPFEGDGIIRRGIENGSAVSPKAVTEGKKFKAGTPAEALQIAQYIAYHIARVINPHEFSSAEKQSFAEVFILELKDSLGNKLEIPTPGNHFADSAVRKMLRGNGENQLVEIVGLNSDMLHPYDWLTANGKRKSEPNYREPGEEEIKFMKELYPFFNQKLPVNFFPLFHPNVIMLSYHKEHLEALQADAKAAKAERASA